MRRHTQRHANDRKSHARERNEKRLLISVRLALRSRVFSLLSCSSNCAIDRAERLGRFFLFVVQLFEADRQRAFHHVDAVADLVEVERSFESRSW